MDIWKVKNKIWRREDFRGRQYDRVDMRFCSVLDTNLADTAIKYSGTFIGNGWRNCSFCRCSYYEIHMEAEIWEYCSMGNVKLKELSVERTTFTACGFTEETLECAAIRKCRFSDCSFRKMRIPDISMEDVLFEKCAFESICLSDIHMKNVRFRNCTFCNENSGLLPGCIYENCRFDS